MSLIVERVCGDYDAHAMLPEPLLPQTRLTDAKAFDSRWDQPNEGFTPGYTYPCETPAGNIIAIGCWGSEAILHLVEEKGTSRYYGLAGRGKQGLGENTEFRLHGLNIVYAYQNERALYVRGTGSPLLSEQSIILPGTVYHEGHCGSAPKANRHAIGIRLDGGTRVVQVCDTATLKCIDHALIINKGIFDISISGQWVLHALGADHNTKPRYACTNIDTGQQVIVPTQSMGHHAFCTGVEFDALVYQDNNTDWWTVFYPETNYARKIIYLGELQKSFTSPGKLAGYHAIRTDAPGWCLVSTYDSDDSLWSSNQLMFINIHEAHDTRIIRLGHSTNRYMTGEKVDSYPTEGFAGITGRNIYIGSNNRGTEPLNVWRMELPEGWEKLGLETPPTPPEPPQPPAPVWMTPQFSIVDGAIVARLVEFKP